MKIVYLIRSFAAKGGLERIFIEKMNYLSDKTAHDIYALTYEQGSHPFAYPLSPKVKHMDLNCRFFTLKRFNFIKQIYLYTKLFLHYKHLFTEKIKEIQPDIVICTNLFFGDIFLLSHLPNKIITIVESHSPKSTVEHTTKSSGPINWLYKTYDYYIYHCLKRCSALITLTQGDAKAWAPIKKSIVIPNFVSFYPEKLNQSPNNKKIISVGRLANRQKGYDLLIQAWKKIASLHTGWTVHIYGEGEDKVSLLKDIKENHLEDSFIIHDPTSDIIEKYMESEFYVLSSHHEGFALVLVEAMACGLPCISFDCPYGPAEIICHKENGLLVKAENIDELAEKISYMIEHHDLRKEMGKKARENVKRYLPDQILPLWEKLFQELRDNQMKANPNNLQ